MDMPNSCETADANMGKNKFGISKHLQRDNPVNNIKGNMRQLIMLNDVSI